MDTVMITYGNPANGFRLIGPVVPNSDEAEMITEWLSGETWWYLPVTSPADLVTLIAEGKA